MAIHRCSIRLLYVYIYMYRETAGGDDWNELVSRLVNDHL